jgi:riboflavin synthase
MFTGIVAAVGSIVSISPLEEGKRLVVDAGTLGLDDAGVGDSIAVSGCCLTVVGKEGNRFFVDVSKESLACTAGLDAEGPVNLEKALRLADRIGGHLVTGHIDGVGTVVRFDRAGESYELEVSAPDALAKYIAAKGSITVCGVSLTVNRVAENRFTVNLIPHTLEVTTLKYLKPGSTVNLEIDLIARYVERMLGSDGAAA